MIPIRGSRSVEQGADRQRLRLLWEEQGVTDAEPTRRRGFGTRLIERACTYELEGEVEPDYAPRGLRCKLMFPLS
jgi:two-component sensor histidine kinase